MIIMNKYCESKWDRTRPAYTIRGRKYRRIEELRFHTSTSVSAVYDESSSGEENTK